MLKSAIAIIAAFALLLGGCAAAPQEAGDSQAPQAAQPQQNLPQGMMRQPAAEGAQGAAGCGMGMTMMQGMCTPVVSMAELASHNAESDCWVGYGGRAYDITSYIPNHKNYQKLIVPLCGTAGEFKAAFEGKHGMSKVDVLEGQPMMGALLQ